jgi:putative membrane protein
VPVDNVQVVTIRQGLIQRWLGLVTVDVDTAGASLTSTPAVVDVALEDGATLARDLAAAVS